MPKKPEPKPIPAAKDGRTAQSPDHAALMARALSMIPLATPLTGERASDVTPRQGKKGKEKAR
jgi:hypothetical protein